MLDVPDGGGLSTSPPTPWPAARDVPRGSPRSTVPAGGSFTPVGPKENHLADAPRGAIYVRTTGIWQSVWLEPVPDPALRRPRLTPDVAGGVIRLEQPITGNAPGLRLRATLSDAGGEIARAECAADLDLAPRLDLPIPVARRRFCGRPAARTCTPSPSPCSTATAPWSTRRPPTPPCARVSIDGKAIRLNGESVFQRLVLDQGYYADGIMTAPTDETLRRDIELSMAAGFNGARLHQKVFEERFLCHADRLGYLLWGEFGDWGCRGEGPVGGEHQKPGADSVTQWLEVLERDYSHPSIVGWCPLNETWQKLGDRITVLDDVTRACSWPPRRWTPRARSWTPPATRTASRRRMSTTATTIPRIRTSWRNTRPVSRRATHTGTVPPVGACPPAPRRGSWAPWSGPGRGRATAIG